MNYSSLFIKVVMKNTRKHNRQQAERTRETEIARAKAADLAVQLRKVHQQQCRGGFGSPHAIIASAQAQEVGIRENGTSHSSFAS